MGKFVIKQGEKGYSFRLKAGNNETIAVSEVYTTLSACKKGIASVVRNARDAALENQTAEGFRKQKHPKFEVYQDKAGEFRFRLRAVNGQIVAASEGYKAVASALGGVESVRENAADAPIEIEEK